MKLRVSEVIKLCTVSIKLKLINDTRVGPVVGYIVF